MPASTIETPMFLGKKEPPLGDIFITLWRIFVAITLATALFAIPYCELSLEWMAVHGAYQWTLRRLAPAKTIAPPNPNPRKKAAESPAQKKPLAKPAPPLVPTDGNPLPAIPNLFRDVYGIRVKGTDITATTTDWNAQIKKAWAIKCRQRCTDVAQSFGAKVGSIYPAAPHRMTITTYVSLAGQAARDVRTAMYWQELAEAYHLTSAQSALLTALLEKIGGKELIAYALTELMPSSDGRSNRAALNFLLQNAGREYVELLPAVNDRFTSFGPFQPTQFALYEVEERRGASKTNQFLLKKMRIPGSVQELRGDAHFRMAILFVIDNLASIVGMVEDGNLPDAKTVRSADLVSIVACAHHQPAPCRTAGARWLTDGAKKPFSLDENTALTIYIKKTRANLQAFD